MNDINSYYTGFVKAALYEGFSIPQAQNLFKKAGVPRMSGASHLPPKTPGTLAGSGLSSPKPPTPTPPPAAPAPAPAPAPAAPGAAPAMEAPGAANPEVAGIIEQLKALLMGKANMGPGAMAAGAGAAGLGLGGMAGAGMGANSAMDSVQPGMDALAKMPIPQKSKPPGEGGSELAKMLAVGAGAGGLGMAGGAMMAGGDKEDKEKKQGVPSPQISQ